MVFETIDRSAILLRRTSFRDGTVYMLVLETKFCEFDSRRKYGRYSSKVLSRFAKPMIPKGMWLESTVFRIGFVILVD